MTIRQGRKGTVVDFLVSSHEEKLFIFSAGKEKVSIVEMRHTDAVHVIAVVDPHGLRLHNLEKIAVLNHNSVHRM